MSAPRPLHAAGLAARRTDTMTDIATVTLLGRLGADPERKHTQQGRAVARFRIAVNRGRKTADDQWEEHTDWYGVTAFGALAERAAERLAKGSRVLVQGRLEPRTWDGPDSPRTFLDVVASEVIPLERAEGRQPAADADGHEAVVAEATEPPDPDDLPF